MDMLKMTKKYKIWYEEFEDDKFIYIFKSPRGGAKSSSMMDYLMFEFEEEFNMFYWLRRKETEITNELPKLIPPWVMEKHGIKGFKCQKGGVFITYDGKNYVQCGFYGAISTFKKGQRVFQHVTTIVFDEYNDTVDLLPQEKFKFWNAIATIVDTRTNYKIVFLGNETIFYNPYEYLEERPGVKVVEIKELDQSYIDTPLYNAVKGTDVGAYMFESNFFKNFKWFYNEKRFSKINKKIIANYLGLDIYYIKDDDVVVLNIGNSNNSISRAEFTELEPRLREYYNEDRFYYTDKETYKKVSEVMRDFVK